MLNPPSSIDPALIKVRIKVTGEVNDSIHQTT